MSCSVRTYTQPGGAGWGALRSNPTTSSKRPANRRITASPIRPLEPLTMMIPRPGVMAFPPVLGSGSLETMNADRAAAAPRLVYNRRAGCAMLLEFPARLFNRLHDTITSWTAC